MIKVMTKRSTWQDPVRESCSQAERQLEASVAEGSFGTGNLNRHTLPVGFHVSSPLTDNEL